MIEALRENVSSMEKQHNDELKAMVNKVRTLQTTLKKHHEKVSWRVFPNKSGRYRAQSGIDQTHTRPRTLPTNSPATHPPTHQLKLIDPNAINNGANGANGGKSSAASAGGGEEDAAPRPPPPRSTSSSPPPPTTSSSTPTESDAAGNGRELSQFHASNPRFHHH